MVRHVIVWTLKDEYSDSEKAEIKAYLKYLQETDKLHEYEIVEPPKPVKPAPAK